MKALSSTEISVLNDSTINECSAASGLIALAFSARNITHLAHLSVTGPGSYATHKALDEFYNGIITLTDSFAECYQGRYGLITCYPSILTKCVSSESGKNSILTLRNWIDANRGECGEASELQNIIDEILDLCNSILYKLTYLS